MAKQDIIISIQLKGAEGVSKSTDKVANSQKQLREMMSRSAVELEKLNIKKKRQKQLNVQIAKSELGYSEAVGKTAAQLKASKTQAGLNNAILLESGRLASDASYGFTAMANNLSQLVSLFGSFAKTSGGLVASLKDLGRSLLGTGGVLLGVQLLIGALQSKRVLDFVKSFNGLSPRLRELTNLTEGYSKATEELVGNFNIYIGKLLDSNQSEEQKAIALEKLNKEYPDFNASILTSAQNTDEATEAVERYIEKLKEQALSRAAIQEYQKVQGEQDKELYEVLLKQQKAEDDLAYQRIQLQKAVQQANDNTNENLTIDFAKRVGQIQAVITETENAIKNYKAESTTIATEYKKRLDIIDDYIIIVNDKNEEGSGKRERNFKQHLLNLDKLEESYRHKAIDTQMMTAEEIINEEEKNAIKELDIRRDTFIKKQEQRLQEFKESTDNAEEIAKAEAEFNESKRLAQVEHDEVMIQLTAAFNTKRTQLTRKQTEEDAKEQERADDILKKYLDGRIETQKTFEEESNELYYNANENRIQQDMDFIAKRIELETDDVALRAELQTQFYALQDELRQNDLERELSAIEAKKNVNMEYVGFAEQTGSLLEKLGNRSKALANVALAVEKGAAIAKVIVSAQASIAAKTASANAIPAFLPPFGTPNPSFLVAQAEAKASNTRTKISAALSIANILASLIGKKGAPKDTSGGGGTGGGVQIQAPDFNVVGASQTSQLAQAVTEQQAKPVKAFVVGKDISTQQELDRNITNTASFG